jgi:TPR repeat protein
MKGFLLLLVAFLSYIGVREFSGNETAAKVVAFLILVVAPVLARLQIPLSRRELETLRKKADAGDAEAMFNLGVHHSKSKLPNDNALAVSWYRKAADAGNAVAMYNLGVHYANGQCGLPKEEGQAVVWYRKAVESGNASAMNNLGLMYENGQGGLPKDHAIAVSFYRSAALAGNELAKVNLKRIGKTL